MSFKYIFIVFTNTNIYLKQISRISDKNIAFIYWTDSPIYYAESVKPGNIQRHWAKRCRCLSTYVFSKSDGQKNSNQELWRRTKHKPIIIDIKEEIEMDWPCSPKRTNQAALDKPWIGTNKAEEGGNTGDHLE